MSQKILLMPNENDITESGYLIYEAFSELARLFNFPSDFQDVSSAISVAKFLITTNNIYGVVAKENNRITGLGFIDERDDIRAIGPLAVNTKEQNKGTGKELMEILLAKNNTSPSIRLVQDAYNMKSLALYSNLGFTVKEPLILLSGKINKKKERMRKTTRKLGLDDLILCNTLYRDCISFSRLEELRELILANNVYGTFDNNRLIAYTTNLLLWKKNHGVAISEKIMIKHILEICEIEREEKISFLLPVRYSSLLKTLLGYGLQIVKMMNLMVKGDYKNPKLVYLPSVHY